MLVALRRTFTRVDVLTRTHFVRHMDQKNLICASKDQRHRNANRDENVFKDVKALVKKKFPMFLLNFTY